MSKRFFSLFTGIILLFTGCYPPVPGSRIIDLKKLEWTLRDESDSIILKNANPSDLFLALTEKKVIPDPFYGVNEQKVQWVSERDWTYSCRIYADDNLLKFKNIRIVFEGLDTYASVFFNDTLIIEADNMFRRREADVKKLIKPENNVLKVVFHSPVRENEKRAADAGYRLPDIRGFSRKAAYQYGWDWGPRLVTSGIWKPVFLKADDKIARIKSLYIRTKKLSNNKATVEILTDLFSDGNYQAFLTTFVNRRFFYRKKIFLTKGENRITDSLSIDSPRLWWPNGYGKQNLYTFTQELSTVSRQEDRKSVVTGLRTVELVRKKESDGRSFYFKINGKAVFAKGANVIPFDNFPARVDDKKYRTLLYDAGRSGMNMLRVWGGGYYEKDIFYRLCDSLGLMVWQDFMFAGNMVPTDDAFARNVAVETAEQIVRLRNHPSLVLWCGNNEIDEAWNNWGWQRSMHYTPEDSAALWRAYLRIFDTIIPENVQHLSPSVPYWPSSPSTGWGHPEAFTDGDVHYWGVWWGKEPFESYLTHTGRFMSEYGFQGIPPLQSIREFCPEKELYLDSPAMKNHQKHPFGDENIRLYMERYYPVPRNFEDYIYVSQLLQAFGTGMAIEAHRRNKPRCMGTLYWQLNDCWPAISWSSVDYYGRWKALQYRVAKDFKPVLIDFVKTASGGREIWLVSDTVLPQGGNLERFIYNLDGQLLNHRSIKINRLGDTSARFDVVPRKLIPDTSSTLIYAQFTVDGTQLSEKYHLTAYPKNIRFPDPEIQLESKRRNGIYELTVHAGKAAVSVYLSCNADGHFSDNFFDLFPGQTREIRFYPSEPVPSCSFKIKSLADIR